MKTKNDLQVYKESSYLLPMIGGVLIVGLLSYGAFQFYTLNTLKTELDVVSTENNELTMKIDTLIKADVLYAINAQDKIEESEDSIRWSNVVRKVRDLVPKDKDNNYIVSFYNYSGNEKGDLRLVGMANSKDSIVRVMNVFNDSSYFDKVFIFNISKAENSEGDELFNFNMEMKFLGSDLVNNQNNDGK